jgi:hypothetical protein
MLAEASRTRGFWHDITYTIIVPIISALLLLKARSASEATLVVCITFVALLWAVLYALTNGYVPYTYGAARRFTVSNLNRLQAFRHVDGFLDGEPRRYTLASYWPLTLKPGDVFIVLKHPYRNGIVWISRRSARRHGQGDRFDAMPSNPLPIYYEDMVQHR